MNRTRSKHSAVDGQTLPKRRPQTKDGQAPVPRVIVFPILTTFAFPAEIPSLQVGPLGHPRPWLFRESRSCVVELVARQSTGWVCLSFQFRVSSWIVLAAHRREMQWPFSPWSIGWSVQGQKLEHIDSARSRPALQGLSLGVVSTPYCRAAKGPDPHKRGGSRLNISDIGGNFARIRSPILVHPG
uniref:Uncharacterized protein n=1 Tax=Gossypium raimondii TaxID=29730 RepID=A0A0D2NAA5_GOSRA|nr:hypothetical protein B456_001G163500 [Gossypium raimondii]